MICFMLVLENFLEFQHTEIFLEIEVDKTVIGENINLFLKVRKHKVQVFRASNQEIKNLRSDDD